MFQALLIVGLQYSADRVMECLRNASVDALLEREWITHEFLDFPWVPVIDGQFIIEDPLFLLRRGNIKNGELLAGSNYDEANFFLVYDSDIYNPANFFHSSEFITSDQIFAIAAQRYLPKKFHDKIPLNAILQEYCRNCKISKIP